MHISRWKNSRGHCGGEFRDRARYGLLSLCKAKLISLNFPAARCTKFCSVCMNCGLREVAREYVMRKPGKTVCERAGHRESILSYTFTGYRETEVYLGRLNPDRKIKSDCPKMQERHEDLNCRTSHPNPTQDHGRHINARYY